MYSCKCEESKKPLEERDWEISTWQPYKWWGTNCDSYDGRLLIDIMCNKCDAFWRNSNRNSIYWDLIDRSPYDIHIHPYKINILDIGKDK